jgi:cell division septum initiation protein DivIVA
MMKREAERNLDIQQLQQELRGVIDAAETFQTENSTLFKENQKMKAELANRPLQQLTVGQVQNESKKSVR